MNVLEGYRMFADDAGELHLITKPGGRSWHLAAECGKARPPSSELAPVVLAADRPYCTRCVDIVFAKHHGAGRPVDAKVST